MIIRFDDLKALCLRSRIIGTEHKWMELALEWCEAADDRIKELELKLMSYEEDHD